MESSRQGKASHIVQPTGSELESTITAIPPLKKTRIVPCIVLAPSALSPTHSKISHFSLSAFPPLLDYSDQRLSCEFATLRRRAEPKETAFSPWA